LVELYYAIFAGGVGLAAGVAAKNILELLRLPFDPFRTKLRSLRIKTDKRKVQFSLSEYKDSLVLLSGALAGGVFGLMLAWGTNSARLAGSVGSAVGMGVAWFIKHNIQESTRMKKLREVVALYEAVDFYTRAGYTVEQSLRLGAVLTPTLRSCVERCLAAWPSSPSRALERFAEDVGIQEAEMLSSVLMHIIDAGMKFGRAAIEEESRSLEELRQTLAEVRIVSKPLYYAIYRALPLAAIGGVVVGPLLYRLVNVLGNTFSGM
jgi:hypothetical protein